MRWRGRRQSTNIEDRRGGVRPAGFPMPRGGVRVPAGRTARRAGGGGLVGLLLVGVILWLVAGINPLTLLQGVDPADPSVVGGRTAPSAPVGGAREQELEAFVATVLAETEDTWNALFRSAGAEYDEPTLVLFSGRTGSACGFAGAATGPFYCPPDRKVYLDLDFFRELARRFGAPGDFAQAYVIAHEIGHHVQNQLGVLGRANDLRRQVDAVASNRISVRIELQADCLAGIWAHHADRQGLLERGDVAEALEAARAVGDDTIQRRAQGYVVPESFGHGTGEQRQRWFMTGLETGDVAACDTFNAQRL